MAIWLPPLFIDRMQRLLGDEFDAFMKSYEAPKYAGIRVNTLKISNEQFRDISPFALRQIPWCDTGYYIQDDVKPGKHPYYYAGLYYIQEPSAMSPVEVLQVEPGDRVLDLCAAPGGKSTQIAAKLQGQGVLVTNDINSERTKALAKNIELYGVRNAVVLNESPERIANVLPHFFNKILIDAPCSGEGMFRKDEDMAKQWATHSVEKCMLMQRDILKVAASLLAPGGTIVYSTCTFSPEENEAMIAEFLDAHEEFHVMPIGGMGSFAPGRPDWLKQLQEEDPEFHFSKEAIEETAGCGRLWPHLIEGEGHFVTVLKHGGDRSEPSGYEFIEKHWKSNRADRTYVREEQKRKSGRPNKKEKHSGQRKDTAQEHLESYVGFAQQELDIDLPGITVTYGDHVYQTVIDPSLLQGLKVVRPGFYTGTVKNGRFMPSHPLAAALHPEEAKRVLELSSDHPEAIRYLKGETLQVDRDRILCKGNAEPKGYVLVCVDGYAMGWGKWLDGILKNEYPAGWRWMGA
ncbi:RsmB/NOP family class I SAM-dependent RNA methyltransferase [Paenibacillus sediminis]|uniref:NOL1/NOP2/sun family putative RNA methylase n=1 Tax=Paenibacillus sediminis TaxID=664909 RepID=A0ABS4H5B6_9BACL|nr:RsmB/NOP family class I SAM-dependent RNA methyltransferase [Paenibacillus sediminis]MBP1937725.1 NOL1/NOP2/sun family putative RNA methylase [Paenibacillus sediminis]